MLGYFDNLGGLSFDQAVEQWKKLLRELPSDDPMPTAYYHQHVFPTVAERVRERVLKTRQKKYYGLILSVGYSPEPLALSIIGLAPAKVRFLYTRDTERKIDVIVDLAGLKPSDFDKHWVDDKDALPIYYAIKKAYHEWHGQGDIAIDFTGGTKAMSAGAAMAAATLDLDMWYVANDRYIKERRMPEPGSEYLYHVPNPIKVFGDVEADKAADLLELNQFAAAQRILAELVNRSGDPDKRLEARRLLASAYDAWDRLNFPDALYNLEALVSLVEKQGRIDSTFPLREHLEGLREQVGSLAALTAALNPKAELSLAFLQNLTGVVGLAFTFYAGAERHHERGRNDIAALMLYRLLELMEQRRLALRGLDTKEPDYSILADREGILMAFNERGRSAKELPSPIALVDGYRLLAALGEPFGQEVKPRLSKLIKEVASRDKSIFAHGFTPVSDEDYRASWELTSSILEVWCHHEGVDLAHELQVHRFLKTW